MTVSESINIEALYKSQLREWKMAAGNYADLQQVVLKDIPFDGHSIQIQYNPNRILSSSAKIDRKSISQRPCFLCIQSRPAPQEGIIYKENFIILVNPYPVFQRHLTVTSTQHVPQRISGNFTVMLQLARDLRDFVILYNGPGCGASAPDHFHFQAVPQGVLPVERDFNAGIKVKKQGSSGNLDICTWEKYQRNLITLASDKLQIIRGAFSKLYKILESGLPSSEEPMMNIITKFDGRQWIAHVFPRRQHRPEQYFATGKEQIIVSPASIDMSGIMILPREDDFVKIKKADVEDVYRQVCVDDQFIQNLVNQMNNDYD